MAHDSNFVADLAEALQVFSTAHSVGEEWCSFTDKIPVGGVQYKGQMVTRATYADLWEYVQAQGLVKTEAEWQTLSTSGDVPYYSSGDGSTTFRMPKKSDSTEGVYAFGEIVNAGELDATTLASGLSTVEAKVSEVETGLSDYLKSDDASNTYLTKDDASSTYLGKTAKAASATTADKASKDGNGNVISDTYLTKDTASSTYLSQEDASEQIANSLLVSEKCNQTITINGYETEYITITGLIPYKPVYFAAKNITGKGTIDVIVTSGSVLDAPLSTSMVIQESQNAVIWFPVIPTGTSLEIAVGDNSGNQVQSTVVAYQ